MNILLIGYGAMGKNFESIINSSTNHKIIDIRGKEIEPILNLDNVPDFDVLIDFTHPNYLDAILAFLQARKKPGVICTTGFKEEQILKMKETAKNVPILFSRNMSLGISVMKKVIKEINRALDYKFDVEITETHHNKKLDAPSGTSLMLAEALKSDKDDYELINREHENRLREKNEIAIHAIRGGSVVGDHSVFFFGEDEYIEVKHVASSKKLFCYGAIKAAEFIANKVNGFYSLDDAIEK